MASRPVFSDPLAPDLQPICDALVEAANYRTGNAAELLRMLRFLENFHQWLRDKYYMQALPMSRQELFDLLLQMEQQGDWPHLPRTQLRTLLQRLDDPDGGASPHA